MENTTLRKNAVELLVVGDVHLGHPNTPTTHILPNLRRILPDNAETAQLDVVIIEGDLFDRLLYLNNEHLSDIQHWVIRTLVLCKKHDIALRVLEGTPGHDMQQSKMFITLNEAYDIGADVRWVTKLSVEIHPTLGVSFLYLPDEYGPPDICYEHAVRCLQENGLSQVDFVVMHGQFDYQLPPHVNEKAHSSALWQPLAKYNVFVGHVHQHSQNGNIIAAGSFDRLVHGDESPKGHVRVRISPTEHSIRFVENKGAKRYDTVDCRGLSVEEAIDKIRAHVAILPKGAWVRVWALRTDSITSAKDVLRLEYPDFTWDYKIEKPVENVTVDYSGLALTPDYQYVPIDLTETTLPELLKARLVQNGLDVTDVEGCMRLVGPLL